MDNLELPEGGVCAPLRRHSFSAPSLLVLDACLDRCAYLSDQVDRVIKKAREDKVWSKSVTNLDSLDSFVVVEELLKPISGSSAEMPGRGQCHHCHRPLHHPEHVGIAGGVNKCTLEHFDLCPGGRTTQKDWTGCPFETGEGFDDETSLGETTPTSIQDEESKLLEDQADGAAGRDSTLLDPEALRLAIEKEASKATQVHFDDNDDDEDTDDEEERLLQDDIERLRVQVDLEKQARLHAEASKMKEEKKRLKKERLANLERQKSELLNQSRAYSNKYDSSSGQHAAKPQANNKNSSDKELQLKAADLASKQQSKTYQDMHKNMQGLTVAGIRALPGMTQEVEEYLVRLQSTVPSLAKTPSAPMASGGVTFQPAGVFQPQVAPQLGSRNEDEVDNDFVYSASRGKLVQVVHDTSSRGSPHGTTRHQESKADEEASDDEDCQIEPEKGFSLKWFRDKSGNKYFVQEKVEVIAAPKMVKAYVFDEATGRYYQRMVPSDSDQPKSRQNQQNKQKQQETIPKYHDHRFSTASPIPQVTRGLRSPATATRPASSDRFPEFLRGEQEKQGRDSKVPEIVQWARNCPVSWTSKVTTDKLNVVLWAWSYVSELLATRTGQAPNLEQGELEAKLQHFCNVLEITLQSSTQNDFSEDAWNIGKLYHQKVQQKVESRQFSWVQLDNINHGATHPHELMAAHQELAKKPEKARRERENNGEGRKLRCGTWNKSEVRGKCQYEVENPSAKCKRLHECTYCKSKSYTPVNHQRTFCPKRSSEEG